MPACFWKANCSGCRRGTVSARSAAAGLLLALDLKLPIGASIVAQAFAEGVLLNSPQPDALRFMPALNVTRAEISEMIDCLDAILTKVGAARRVA